MRQPQGRVPAASPQGPPAAYESPLPNPYASSSSQSSLHQPPQLQPLGSTAPGSVSNGSSSTWHGQTSPHQQQYQQPPWLTTGGSNSHASQSGGGYFGSPSPQLHQGNQWQRPYPTNGVGSERPSHLLPQSSPHGPPNYAPDSDLESVMNASKETAAIEAERRARAESEEAEIQRVLEASRREHEERQQRLDDEQRVLAESREAAERAEVKRREEAQQHDAAVAASRAEAARMQERMEAEEERMREIEKAVIEASRKEMEAEWARRDSVERARFGSPTSGEFSPNGSQTAYWGHLRYDEASRLAEQFEEARIGSTRRTAEGSPSEKPPLAKSPSGRRPLPQVPEIPPGSSRPPPLRLDVDHSHRPAAVQVASPANGSHMEDEEESDPFTDEAEAPPAYWEGPSPSAPLVASGSSSSDLTSSSHHASAAGVHQTQSPRSEGPLPSPAIDIGSFEAVIEPGEDDTEDTADLLENPLLSATTHGRRYSRSLVGGQHPFRQPRQPDNAPSSTASGSTPSALSSSGSLERNGTVKRPPIPATTNLLATPVNGASSTSPASTSTPSSPRTERSSSFSRHSLSSPTMTTVSTLDATDRRHTGSVSPSPSTTSKSFAQSTLNGVDFGYSREPFSQDLYVPVDEEGGHAYPASASPTAKAYFPNLIQLSMPAVDGKSLSASPSVHSAEVGVTQRGPYFVIRAFSWRGLLRAMAWFGNTRIEAGPAEVASAAAKAEHEGKNARGAAGACRLEVEVEFVTPARTDTATNSRFSIGGPAGLGSSASLAASAQARLVRKAAAHVSICLSLVRASGRTFATDDLGTALKKASRELDASYLERGSTRRVLHLPLEPPVLPLDMVSLAQRLHKAHSLSAACPTSSSHARHSPRDLHHAIERHDVGYVVKIVRARRAAAAAAETSDSAGARPGRGFGTMLDKGKGKSSPNSLHAGPSSDASSQHSDRPLDSAAAEMELFEDDDELGGADLTDPERGGLRRMKDKVKRRLAKRDPNDKIYDEGLESWITPFDLSQHG